MRDGAHESAMPVVPCAHEISGQPAFGARPFGTASVPDTAVLFPFSPVER